MRPPAPIFSSAYIRAPQTPAHCTTARAPSSTGERELQYCGHIRGGPITTSTSNWYPKRFIVQVVFKVSYCIIMLLIHFVYHYICSNTVSLSCLYVLSILFASYIFVSQSFLETPQRVCVGLVWVGYMYMLMRRPGQFAVLWRHVS
ncbi:hypothetical protein FIBSPDRAFT_842605 [Athelia psychrophila]|uniref:Uncharacterized protein n=1 Tax=Athelia psychrophila TaxID=1759441 RepID=A0A167WCE8_9AGAM|nr:hypothetical protein FIBSPDRAFT_842605 [Fibularhizoctonia sp. CBS 109695]